MSEKPHTLSIDSTEWHLLLASNIERVREFVNGTQTLTPESLAQLHEHLDRAKLLARAWLKSTRPTPEVRPAAIEAADVPAKTNGVKRRRGRPSRAEVAARTNVQ